MSLEAYLDTIEARTGQTPDDFRAYAVWQGYLDKGAMKPGIEIGAVIADLKRDFGLGATHAMAVYALMKGFKEEGAV